MDKFLQDNNYANIFFILAVATFPFMTIGLIYETTLTRVAYILSGVFALCMIVCFCFTKRLPLAPTWIIKDLQSLFFPYTLTVSTAIYSIDEGPFYGGYLLAFAAAIGIIISNHILPKRRYPKDDDNH